MNKTVRILVLAAGLAIHCAAPAQGTAPAAVSFQIDQQPLADALAAFAKQANLQVIQRDEKVSTEGLVAPRLYERLTAKEALTRLLANTGLRFEFVNERTVTIRAGKSGAQENSSTVYPADQMMLALTRDADPKGSPADPDDTELQVQVTGSRIRGIAGEQGAQPVLTITQRDIERLGVSSLGDVLRYIPQISSSAPGAVVQQSNTIGTAFGDLDAARVTATLRGAPAGGTLLLINGRRAPRNGELRGRAGYDLSGIPLAAIERIDVLLDGASAIYGADAVGGVINVILKKEHTGTDMRVGYENTFDTDASIKTASLNFGLSKHRFSTLVTASAEDAMNVMMWRDRPFLATFDRRAYGGQGISTTAPAGGTGSITASSGTLPGLTVSSVAIPAGSTGVGLTVNDYRNAGAPAPIVDLAQFAAYSTPYRRQSAAARAAFEFGEHLDLYAEYQWGDSEAWTINPPLAASRVFVPAGAPGNPFGTTVLLSKLFYDLPHPSQVTTALNQSRVLGSRGALSGSWRYDVSVSQVLTKSDLRASSGTTLSTGLVMAALADPDPARRPILFYDSTSGSSPNPAGALAALTSTPGFSEHNESRVAEAQVDGTLMRTWAGELQVAAGAEVRRDFITFPIAFLSAPTPRDRRVSGYYAEVKVPLAGARQAMPGLHDLTATVSARHDRYSDFPSATSLRYSLLYRPMEWLTLRGSFGEGYKVPTLSQLSAPPSELFLFFAAGSIRDPARGNEAIASPLRQVTAGNPALRPERSENRTAGLILDLPFVQGLSLQVDYFDTRYLDRVGQLPVNDAVILLPQNIERGPNRPGDLPGWPGPITTFNNLSMNIAFNRIEGHDITLRYEHRTAFGDIDARILSSKITRNELRSAPSLAPTANSTTTALPQQVTGSVFLGRGALEMGVVGTYRGKYFLTTLPPVIYTPSAINWDMRWSYELGRLGSTLGRALNDARIGLTIFNVLNTVPPFSSTGVPDNRVVDSRLRRYALDLTLRF